jgi:FtsP/CotA-like multicopper oxidase with cupredoxin domain
VKAEKDQERNMAGQEACPTTRRDFIRAAAGVAAGLTISELLPDSHVQAAANTFSPPELAYNKNGTLQAVIQMVEAQRSYPNGPAKGSGPYLRMFQGWYPARSRKSTKPVINPDQAGPGPTLRGRVGGKVEVTFINKVDETKFPYSINTAEGVQYGCDATTPVELYPAADTWPNCFHGSSTANLHFVDNFVVGESTRNPRASIDFNKFE